MSALDGVDPAIKKWAKWVVVFLVLRTPRPLQWSSFLALNPLIKKAVYRSKVVRASNDEDKQRNVGKVANLLSSLLLFSAVLDNPKIPNDYGIIYIWSNYIGELNPPSHSQILVSPKSSRYFKLSHYNSPTLRKLYYNKQFVIFPLIFAQILSNYLTPTKFKLNQRYLSSSIKSRILNPIWINFSLGVNSHSLNWLNLIKSYIKHNVAFFVLFGLLSFKKRLLDHYYELKHKVYHANDIKTFPGVIKNYFLYVFHRSSSLTNFIYLPNLLSILLISLTAPILRYVNNSTHKKFLFKSYIKSIGFIAGFVTLYANSMDYLPSFGYKQTDYDDTTDSENVRRISDGFLNALSLYLFRLIVLAKWRIAKENHPYFRILKLKTWNRLEAVLFCFGVWKLMNLNNFLKTTSGKDYGLRQNGLIKLIDKIM